MRRAPTRSTPAPKRNSTARPKTATVVRLGSGAALLGSVYLLLWLYVDPVAWYYGSAPVFSTSIEFLETHVEVLGGLLQYGAAFFGQLAYHAWLGAFVLLIMTGLLSLSTAWLTARTSGHLGPLWAFPALIILFEASRYVAGVLELGGGVLLTLGALALWLALPFSSWRRLAIFSALGLALFYLTGPLPSLLFIGAGGLHQIMKRRDTRLLWVYWLWVLAWLVGVATWSGLDPTGLWGRLDSGLTRVAAAALYAFLPLTWFGVIITEKMQSNRDARTPARAPRLDVSLPVVQIMVGAVVLTLFGLSLDPEQRALRRVQSEAERENWSAVLIAAARLRKVPVPARLQINRALYHEGRLTSDLFSFPQRRGSDLLASLMDGLDVCLPLSDTLVELGHVNLAEHYAHEALEVQGERPEILWRLGWINLLKERPEAARVFFNRLAKVPFHRARARRWLRALGQDQALATEPTLLEARSRRVTVDSVERHFSTQELLWQALRSNRHNAMANDYLMAQFLLDRQPEEVLQNIGLLDSGVSRPLPRHLAEALLALSSVRRAPALDIRGREFASEIVGRFARFSHAMAEDPARTAEASATFIQDFGDTYWFYDAFGHSAQAKPLLRKERQ
jgi:Family of unknown function (DUF6057)